MKIIFRYLTFALIQPLIFCLVAFYFLSLIWDLFDTLPDVVKSDADLGTIVMFYLVQIPQWAQTFIPYAFFFAILYLLSDLSRAKETIAIQSGGVSLATMSIPFLLIALSLSLVQYILFIDLSPSADARRKALSLQIRGADEEANIFDALVYQNPFNGNMWMLQELNMDEKSFRQGEILIMNEAEVVTHKYYAAAGNWNAEKGCWDLANVRRFNYYPDGTTSAADKYQQLFAEELVASPKEITAALRPPSQLPWGDLIAFISAEHQPSAARMAKFYTEHYYRLSYPLMSPVLALFAIAFGVTHGRQNVAASLFNSIFILLFMGMWQVFSVALGNGQRISPIVAGMNTILIFGSVGFYLFADRVGWTWDLAALLKGQRYSDEEAQPVEVSEEPKSYLETAYDISDIQDHFGDDEIPK